ncbi:MAG: TolC family protein [Pirellulales bacterium]
MTSVATVAATSAAAVAPLPPDRAVAHRRPEADRHRDAAADGVVRTAATVDVRRDVPHDPEAVFVDGASPGVDRKLTLDRAIELTLAGNPDLVTLQSAESVSRAKWNVAATYPFNPVLNYDVRPATRERTGETGSTLNTVAITQEIELAHQSRYRNWGGQAELTSTIWTIRHAEAVAIAQAERLFFTAVYQRQLRDVSRTSAELSSQMVDVLKRRFDAGQATTSDVALARIELAAQQRQADLANAAYASALADLSRHLGVSRDDGLEPDGELAVWEWQPLAGAVNDDRDDISIQAAALAARRPDVQSAAAAVDAAAAQLALARANRTPNLTIGPVYERDESGTTFYGVEGSLPIPIVDSGRALVGQRAAELRAAQVANEQLRRKAELEIQDALDRYQRALDSTKSLRLTTINDLAQQVAQVEDQFKAGQTDLLRVFAARASLLLASRAELDALSELTQAAALVTEVTGLLPAALLSPRSNP